MATLPQVQLVLAPGDYEMMVLHVLFNPCVLPFVLQVICFGKTQSDPSHVIVEHVVSKVVGVLLEALSW